jgi:hypothetical protein
MQVIIAGMRRSGTTILFDCLSEDPRFFSIYEPLSLGKTNVGGGSRVKTVPYGSQLNELRREFIQKQNLHVEPSYFNYGAPTDYRLEFEECFPDLYKEYLQFLGAKDTSVLMKFVRVQNKLKDLRETFPDSKLLHIVKDPRRMAMSYLFGRMKRKGIKGRLKYTYVKRFFFSMKNGFNTWNSENLSNYLINNSTEYASLSDVPLFQKIMFLWKYINEQLQDQGKLHFGDDYLQIRHEEFCNNPQETLQHIYTHIGYSLSEDAAIWAAKNLRPPKQIICEGSPKWKKAAEQLGINLSPWDSLINKGLN